MVFFSNCGKEEKRGYAVFYNYSEHNNNSTSYVEIVVPVPFKETHSIYNDSEYSENGYVKGAELIANNDTINLTYAPPSLQGQYFSLMKRKDAANENTSYILLLDEPYKWGSLYESDSLLFRMVNDPKEVRYLDSGLRYHSLHNLNFTSVYFLDGKQVKKGSKEFYRRMNIEHPPMINSK